MYNNYYFFAFLKAAVTTASISCSFLIEKSVALFLKSYTFSDMEK